MRARRMVAPRAGCSAKMTSSGGMEEVRHVVTSVTRPLGHHVSSRAVVSGVCLKSKLAQCCFISASSAISSRIDTDPRRRKSPDCHSAACCELFLSIAPFCDEEVPNFNCLGALFFSPSFSHPQVWTIVFLLSIYFSSMYRLRETISAATRTQRLSSPKAQRTRFAL